MRESSRAIIFKDNKIVLIYREKEGRKYYVLPGGGIELNETKEDCVVREIKEELGINIKPIKQVYEVNGDKVHQYIFLCEWVYGDLGTGNKEEYSINRKGGIQVPMLIDINLLNEIDLLSEDVKKGLLKDIEKHGCNLDSKSKTIYEVAKF